jgi:hypothetical protein
MIVLIVVIFLAVVLAWAAYTYIPHPAGWLLAALIILLAVIYLFSGLNASCC